MGGGVNKLLYVRMLKLLEVVKHSSLQHVYIFFTLKIRTQCYRLSRYQSNRIQFASLVVVVGNYPPPLGSAGLKFDARARIHSICLRAGICLAISRHIGRAIYHRPRILDIEFFCISFKKSHVPRPV